MQINWYPGHMAKARRQLEESIKKVDIVIQLADARIPASSINPDIAGMSAGKRSIIILNKSDLAEGAATSEWVRFYREKGIPCCDINSKRRTCKPLMLIKDTARDILEKYKSKGINKTIRVMVAGIPNVGKSTLINMLAGGKKAKTGDKPGVTRATQWIRLGENIDLLDTPGLLCPKLEDQTAAKHLAYIGTINDEILDLKDLLAEFIREITIIAPDALGKRYGTEVGQATAVSGIMDAICRRRGFIKAGEYDYERAAVTVLDEFRAGKLGRITLERPV